jgi:hypothetical protein
MAAGADLLKTLDGLDLGKMQHVPGAADQALAEGAGASLQELRNCLQREGKLPGRRDGRPMS